MKIALVFLGAFITFFTMGYTAAGHFMSTPDYLKIYVASHTVVKLEKGVVYMRFTDEQGDPFWTYNLNVNKGKFEKSEILRDTMIDAELKAASPFVMTVVSGGSGITILATARDILLRAFSREPGTLKVRIAATLGVVSGSLLGYWVKYSLVGPDTKEIREFIRDPANVKEIKKDVYVLMTSNEYARLARLIDTDDLVVKDVKHKDLGKNFGCTKEDRVKCIVDSTLKVRDNNSVKLRLLREGSEKLANKNDDLEGYEFAVFFMR